MIEHHLERQRRGDGPDTQAEYEYNHIQQTLYLNLTRNLGSSAILLILVI